MIKEKIFDPPPKKKTEIESAWIGILLCSLSYCRMAVLYDADFSARKICSVC